MHVTDAELAILEVLWNRTEATKAELVADLYPATRESDRATVQKLLERLEAKELVSRDRSDRRHVFSARITQTELAGRQLEQLTSRMSNGLLSPLVTHLVENQKLSAKERRELRRILDDSDS